MSCNGTKCCVNVGERVDGEARRVVLRLNRSCPCHMARGASGVRLCVRLIFMRVTVTATLTTSTVLLFNRLYVQ